MQGHEPIIKVRNLKAWYQDHIILQDINFEIYKGEVFLVIGGSGSGKTTLLRCMIGLHQELSGEVIIDNDDIITAYGATKNRILRKIGVMYQSGALFGSMTLLENVMFPLQELSDFSKDAMLAIAKSKLEMVGLGDFCDYLPAEISGGMQKRAAIARAMVFEPKIIFLDEPSSGLDPITSAQIDNLIITLSKILNVTFVVISHELASIYKIGQRVIMLHDRQIIAEGDPKVLRESSENEFVKKFFSRQI